MSIRSIVKSILPHFIVELIRVKLNILSRGRKEGNEWLYRRCRDIRGHVLSIGSGSDSDSQGDVYRNYFIRASSYTTSEVSESFNCDLTLDIRSMPEIKDESYDCVFCNGVLEHVDNYKAGLNEITRILKRGGILFLGLPFRQPLHMAPQDFWRFTEYGIRYMLRETYEILDILPNDTTVKNFPAAYLIMAKKLYKG